MQCILTKLSEKGKINYSEEKILCDELLSMEEQSLIEFIKNFAEPDSIHKYVMRIIYKKSELLHNDEIFDFFSQDKQISLPRIKLIKEYRPDTNINDFDIDFSQIYIDDIRWLIYNGYTPTPNDHIYFYIHKTYIFEDDLYEVNADAYLDTYKKILDELSDYFMIANDHLKNESIILENLILLLPGQFTKLGHNDIRISKVYKDCTMILLKSAQEKFCFDMLEHKELVDRISYLFSYKFDKVIDFLLENGLSDDHINIPLSEKNNYFENIKNKMLANGISSEKIGALKTLYLLDILE